LHHLLPTTLASFSSLFVPKSGGSSNANEIDSLYKITLYIALVIFVTVEGALGYALWKFRKRKGAVAAQIHGNTRLEIGWTLGAALILVVLSVVTFVKLSSIQDPPNSSAGGDALGADSGELYATADKHLPPDGKSLEIQVIGRQFIWQYVYPGASNPDGLGAPYAYTEMVVPTKTTVTLNIVSSDVVHSWWIPALGGKYQAVPGYHNYGWFKIEKPGVYRGQCANLCGRGHARMIAIVHAEEPAEFDIWLANQKRMLEEANAEAAKERAKINSQAGPAGIENP
jgi:cytochrome c oxidase subunit II